MSTTNLRILAAAITLIMAVVVGVLTGVTGGLGTAQCGSGATPGPGQSTGSNQQPGSGQTGGQTTGQTGGQTGGPGQPGESAQPGTGPEQGSEDGQLGGTTGQQNGTGGNQIGTGGVGHVLTAEGTCGGSRFSLLAAVVGFLGTLLTGLACLLIMAAAGRRAAPAGPRAPASVPGSLPVSAPPAPTPADGDRKQLVDTLIYVRDRATSTALTDRIARDLQSIGVTEIRPNGEKFDPSRHEAGGSTDTTDPQQDGWIAGVETPGYLDRGRVLRLPVVTVYRRNS
ncbi:nucleotide exchange factor GrpE [Fodinicola acaciae]|uniref:nucleotide exchange factor GrpE n=1 Tax=Fodinicola acaciae TaxID=2681555 RepID=UPI0013CF6E0F|nr:nucleotide exchange factor GrpE [Fodinicola acaciae]